MVGGMDNSYDTESPAVGEAAYPRFISPIIGQADNKVLSATNGHFDLS
jgi:hypothetical protein